MPDLALQLLLGAGVIVASFISILIVGGVSRKRDRAGRGAAVDLGRAGRARTVRGFSVAILAALTWAAGNVVTQYSAERYKIGSPASAIVDISLANYIGGSVTIVVLSLIIHTYKKRRGAAQRLTSFGYGKRFVLPAIFKGINTYAFVAAVALVSSATAATVENLHVLWTAVLVSVLQRKLLAPSWFVGALIIVIGTALAVGAFTHTSWSFETVGGTGLAFLAGITFALFVITWNQRQTNDNYFPQRALETGVFLVFSGLMILAVHLVIGRYALGGSWIPFSSIAMSDLTIQLINGVFNIGVTYFLMGEALRILEGIGQLSSLLLSLALSYAVAFTVLLQFAILGVRISPLQWCGVALFSVGFAIIRSNLITLKGNQVVAER